jgi:hypothetical protein
MRLTAHPRGQIEGERHRLADARKRRTSQVGAGPRDPVERHGPNVLAQR